MKIGIYPGAFDPVHDGHLAFAEAAMRQYGLDRVYFLPEPTPRHKQGVKALEHRVEMVRLAIQMDKKLGVIVLQQSQFTVLETWPLLTARFQDAQLFMLLGSDVAQRLASWPHIDLLIKTAPRFIVALRKSTEQAATEMIETMQNTTKLKLDYDLLAADYATRSSAEIRIALKAGIVPEGLDESVLRYIRRHKLYISGAT